MKQSSLAFSRFLSAIDPFRHPKAVWDTVLLPLIARLGKSSSQTVAAYVMTPDGIGVPATEYERSIPFYRDSALKAIEALLEPLSRRLVRVEVLTSNDGSSRGAAEKLLSLAEKSKADVIVLATSSSEKEPPFLGRFAEAVLLRSRIPCLFAGSRGKVPDRIEHILFPSDLSMASRFTFDRTLSLALRLKAKMTVLHVVPAALLERGPEPRALPEKVSEARKRAMSWQAVANQLGIPVTIDVIPMTESIPHTISKVANNLSPDLLVLETRLTPSKVLAVGSLPREVIRLAPCPVLATPSVREDEDEPKQGGQAG